MNVCEIEVTIESQPQDEEQIHVIRWKSEEIGRIITNTKTRKRQLKYGLGLGHACRKLLFDIADFLGPR